LLDEKGIKKEDLIETALELFVPHPGVEDKEKAEGFFNKELDMAMADPNISSLILAGLCLEEEGLKGRIPGIKKDEFIEDPVSLVADEILGMAIAEYIGGTRARFEYVRYDTEKPGVLRKLGPIADDLICGLIAGVSSKMYSEAYR
jgi:alpha-ribazole phosphatase CobZ